MLMRGELNEALMDSFTRAVFILAIVIRIILAVAGEALDVLCACGKMKDSRVSPNASLAAILIHMEW